ncbi:Fe3+/spermidine/putrescine ABC transporter ATP-binding protein [Pollutimonas nitritireducens]|uniref:Fe3+/spermidine/putrescine ABC transporter ATP-binding protein n=1 Tax=Pollutimonas nitritireducens TaxID=2045209 RepID=A0A2N4UE24_9BURK|nr:ABC transporter ATP-binding protein [Pollutimonas nitritireducens]PLC53268.1 Fe3+/spermidine/putrescine ABC transporter ATP-binding protein [Pollutimonas nitritireducens]
MTYLILEGLAKRYGDLTVVEDISLEIERGEFLSLLGPSGCGKTTTLQMVAGFTEPTRGRILLEGRDITRTRPEKRGMGIVFQSYALFPHMSVAANIGFGLEMQGMARSERGQRISETLELVRLDGLADRFPRELSGGQRQRVAVARALAIRPNVLLLDEPMSNLDAKLREEMHIELRAIQKKLGITTILVTHDQIEAMTMSDRIAVMHGGKIVQVSTPFEAYERPRSAFASSFLGKTNCIAARITERQPNCCRVQMGGLNVRIPHESAQYADEIQVYIRPEKIRVATPTDSRISSVVRARMFLGNHWAMEVEGPLGRLRVNIPNVGIPPAVEGDTVHLAWQDEDMRMLDAETAHG